MSGKKTSTELGWHEDLLASMIGEDDNTGWYVAKRAFFIGIVLNPLVWIIFIAIVANLSS